MRPGYLAVLLAILAVIAQGVYYYPELPETMASTFGGGGEPVGWSSKGTFFTLGFGVLAVSVFSLVGIGLVMPRFPTGLFNLPHRDYWLAPERRAETVRLIQDQLAWMTVGLLVFVLAVTQLVIDANLYPPPRLSSSFGWLVALFLLGTGVWVFRFVRQFYRVPPGFEAEARR